MEEWEKKLLINEDIQDFEYLGEIIKYKRISWMRQNEIQTQCFKIEEGKPKLDAVQFQLIVLKEGIISGPWNKDVKDAVILKFEPNIADKLTNAITGKNRIETKEELETQIEGLKKKLEMLKAK
jgi:hypothetical protein